MRCARAGLAQHEKAPLGMGDVNVMRVPQETKFDGCIPEGSLDR